MVSPIPYRPTPYRLRTYRLRMIRTCHTHSVRSAPSVTAPYKAPYDTHAFPPAAAPSGTPPCTPYKAPSTTHPVRSIPSVITPSLLRDYSVRNNQFQFKKKEDAPPPKWGVVHPPLVVEIYINVVHYLSSSCVSLACCFWM